MLCGNLLKTVKYDANVCKYCGESVKTRKHMSMEGTLKVRSSVSRKGS